MNESLKIVHIDFARFMFKISTLSKKIAIEEKEKKVSCKI